MDWQHQNLDLQINVLIQSNYLKLFFKLASFHFLVENIFKELLASVLEPVLFDTFYSLRAYLILRNNNIILNPNYLENLNSSLVKEIR